MGHPRKVASRQEGPELTHTQLGIGNSGKLVKARRLSRQNGQSEKRVLSGTFKTRNIQGSGDQEQAAERSERQARQPAVWHPRAREQFRGESWPELELSRGVSEKNYKTWAWVDVFTIETVSHQTTLAAARCQVAPQGQPQAPQSSGIPSC